MRNVHGFTLVEMLITLVLGAILLTLAIPNMQSVIINNRITTQTNELVSALSLARMEAIRRGAPVSLCSSTNQSTCSGAADWSTGWIVLVDNNSSGAPSVSEVIRSWDALDGEPTLVEAASASYIRYLGSGFTDITGGVTRTFTHTITGCTGTQGRTVSISAAGRVSSGQSACP
jgi:type IV fimbrial biogenesis protein FimT